MARIIDAFTQFFDDNGDPLVNGFLKFVESGTNNTDKDTFADVNESIPNANPVPLDGAGRCPNVFGTGAYNVISYTNAMVQIQQFDPVSADTLLGAFSGWDSVTIYDEGDIVVGSNGLYYRSITADNQNQNPVSSPGQWEEFKVIGIWNTNITYASGDSVYGSDGFLYTSRVGSNLGNNPTTDATNWRPGTLNRYTKGADIASANDLPLPDGVSADVTGVITINGVGESLAGTLVVYQFDGILTLKHNTAASAGFDSVDLPGDADITTAAGDIIVLESQGAGNLYRVISYEKADGSSTVIQTGRTIQVVSVQDGEVATGTTTVPLDDTIPQNTEGDEYITLAITPTNVNNKLLIEIQANFATSLVNGTPIIALFQDSNADALISGANFLGSIDFQAPATLRYYMTAGTTSPTTFKVRAGPAVAATLTFNGVTGARLFGGVNFSSITITEVKV